MWNRCKWIKMGSSGNLLWTRKWTFGFCGRRGISWLAEQLLASQEGSMVLVTYLFIDSGSTVVCDFIFQYQITLLKSFIQLNRY
jgi:hypothetical protein